MGLPPPDPRFLCPLSSTEFVEPPNTPLPPGKKFLGTPLSKSTVYIKIYFTLITYVKCAEKM
jgi:hypothetical protein